MTTIAELTQFLERFDGNAKLEVVLQQEEARPFFKRLYASLQPIFGQSESPHESRLGLALRLEIRERALYELNWLKSNQAILEVGFRPFTDTRLHWPSEQVFYRYPVTIPYDSPIFVCVQNGDIGGMRKLFRSCQVPIDVVDPYGLGLLHYGAYYCWRNCGMESAMATCQALLDAGVNPGWTDKEGNTPMFTMTDFMLVEAEMNGRQPFHSLLGDLCRLFGQPMADYWNEYIRTRKLTVLQQVLLGTNRSHGTLNDYLAHIAGNGSLAHLIDAPDALGRSALAWAVEYGLTEAVTTLVGFGANVNQCTGLGLPLLRQALAGPANGRLDTVFLNIVKTLLLAFRSLLDRETVCGVVGGSRILGCEPEEI